LLRRRLAGARPKFDTAGTGQECGLELFGNAIRFCCRETAATFAFTNVNVVDVQSGTIARGETVIVRGDRIVMVSSHGHSVPPGITTIDATGKYLIPGLWDS
jgi:adenine deaminase